MENRSKTHESDSQNVSDIRHSCNEDTVELRKSVKDDQMNKRRNILNTTLHERNSLPLSLHLSLEELIVHMKSDDPILVYRITQAVRKLLSQECNPPIENLIELGIVPICVGLLETQR